MAGVGGGVDRGVPARHEGVADLVKVDSPAGGGLGHGIANRAPPSPANEERHDAVGPRRTVPSVGGDVFEDDLVAVSEIRGEVLGAVAGEDPSGPFPRSGSVRRRCGSGSGGAAPSGESRG